MDNFLRPPGVLGVLAGDLAGGGSGAAAKREAISGTLEAASALVVSAGSESLFLTSHEPPATS